MQFVVELCLLLPLKQIPFVTMDRRSGVEAIVPPIFCARLLSGEAEGKSHANEERDYKFQHGTSLYQQGSGVKLGRRGIAAFPKALAHPFHGEQNGICSLTAFS